MREILFLAHRVPFPPDRGDKIRSYHVLKALAGLGRVHLLSFADDAADAAHADGLAPWLASTTVLLRRRGKAQAAALALASGRPVSLALFDGADMRAAAAELLGHQPIDTVYAFSGQMAQFVSDAPQRRFLMDFVDVDSAKFEGYGATGSLAWRLIHRREGRLLRRFEAAVAARADLSLFVSAAEAALFRTRNPDSADRVAVLGNGIDLDVFRPDGDFAALPGDRDATGPLLLFTGQMDYAPNAEAVDHFVRTSFPAIRRRHPAARFAIVGRAPGAAVQALAEQPGVIVTGEVADVRPWLAAADVVVAPLLLARGIQNKVLEAMAMARAVVASPAAFEGIDAVPGQQLLVADGDRQAEAILGLLADPLRRAVIGRAARRQMVDHYSWARRLAPLAAMVDAGGRAVAA